MALRGTLKDFGLAEIFQLIAQQTKSGVLHLESKDEAVDIAFHEGNVVRAEHVRGKEKYLLGHMLLRADIISERELEDALAEQKRTLKRLGDVLLSRGALSREDLKEMAQLQATETLYRLFGWKSGTYQFEQGEVTWDRGFITPLRGEAVLMEGFRIVDEWPLVRRKIGSPKMTFERLGHALPDEAPEPDFDFDFEKAPAEPKVEIGRTERRVLELIQPGRTVERLIELSRLGEFETTKALANLVTAGHLRVIAPDEDDEASGSVRTVAEKIGAFVTRVALTVAILALAASIAWLFRSQEGALAGRSGGLPFHDSATQRMVSGPQLARIRAALDIYRLETGSYPEDLVELLAAELLAEEDLRYPWSAPYYYRRTDGATGYVLLPPFR